MTTKTTTAKKSKTKPARKLALTSRAKMGAARKAKPAPATDLKATLAAAVEAATAAAQIVPGLDSDAGVPAATIGEVVKPAKAKTKPKATGMRAGVELVKDPKGWFHVEVDGQRAGTVGKSTKAGVPVWKAGTSGYLKRGAEGAITAEGADREAAVAAFVKLWRERRP
jgi:hypothetical protein